MLSITHAAIGGAVGSFVINPALAFGLGIVSHIIIDKIPHFWPVNKEGQNLVKTLDTVCSVSLLIYLFIKFGYSSIFMGALGGVLVDVILVLFADIYKPLFESKIRVWHEKRQPHKTNPVYLFTDIIQIIIGLAIIYFVR